MGGSLCRGSQDCGEMTSTSERKGGKLQANTKNSHLCQFNCCDNKEDLDIYSRSLIEMDLWVYNKHGR